MQLEPFSLKIDPDKVYFWSDLHLFHDRDFVYGRRGFDSVEEHNLTLKNRWNNKIANDTSVYLLGDTVLGHDAEKNFLSFLSQVNFKQLFLMSGNHPAGYKQLYQRNPKGFKIGEKEVYFIPNYYEMYVNKQLMILSHYPLLSWRDMGKGSIHCFGHVHGNLIDSEIGKMYLKGKCLDLGVEVCSEPISFKEILDKLSNKEILKVDHH